MSRTRQESINYLARTLLDRYRGYGYTLSSPGTWKSLRWVQVANIRLGHHWFGEDTMRVFGTWNVKLVGGCLLTWSDRNFDDTGRIHKLAFIAPNGDIHTVVDPQFPTTDKRDEFVDELLAVMRAENIEPMPTEPPQH